MMLKVFNRCCGRARTIDHKKGGTKVARRIRFVSGLIAGAVVGTVAGLIFAPRPGKETQHIVGTRAGALRQKAGEYAGALRERVWRARSSQDVEESSNDHVEPSD